MKSTHKSDFLQIRLTREQKLKLKIAAEGDHISVSEWVLHRLFDQQEDARFESLVGQLYRGANPKFVLAELDDLLSSLDSRSYGDAVASPDARDLAPWLANYVAAMVELGAHQKGVAPPLWCRDIAPLEIPYFGSTLKNLRLHLLTHSPPPFRRRNLFIDTSVGGRV